MPVGAISTITVADATPTNHDFVPTAVGADGVARWNERSASVPAGFWPLSAYLRPPVPGASSQIYKATLQLAIPTLVTETINGVNRFSVERTIRIAVDFLLPATSTLTERQHACAVLKNLVGHASIKDMIENLNTTY